MATYTDYSGATQSNAQLFRNDTWEFVFIEEDETSGDPIAQTGRSFQLLIYRGAATPYITATGVLSDEDTVVTFTAEMALPKGNYTYRVVQTADDVVKTRIYGSLKIVA